MKRIFNKNVSQLILNNNSYKEEQCSMIEIKYKKNKPQSSIKLTGICFDKNDNLILRFYNEVTGDIFYEINSSNMDKFVAKLIFDYIDNKKILSTNFNPYSKANEGIMIFFDNPNLNNNITGIGLDINNNYIVQIKNNCTPKYSNNIFYTNVKHIIAQN